MSLPINPARRPFFNTSGAIFATAAGMAATNTYRVSACGVPVCGTHYDRNTPDSACWVSAHAHLLCPTHPPSSGSIACASRSHKLSVSPSRLTTQLPVTRGLARSGHGVAFRIPLERLWEQRTVVSARTLCRPNHSKVAYAHAPTSHAPYACLLDPSAAPHSKYNCHLPVRCSRPLRPKGKQRKAAGYTKAAVLGTVAALNLWRGLKRNDTKISV